MQVNFITVLIRINQKTKIKRFGHQSFIHIQQHMAHRYNKWTDYEDNILTELIQKYGIGHWSTIARQMKTHFQIPRRNGKQCRQRWFNQLDKTNLNRKWTEIEDLQLIKIQAHLGTRWIEISQNFPGRSDNNVKNHFYSIVRKSIRKMCRYVSIKTTSMKVYSIKPSTLSMLFVAAASESTGIQAQQVETLSPGLNSRFTKQDYCEITQIIHYFIFDNYPSREAEAPAKEKVIDALNKLMEINNNLRKDSSEDINSHDSSFASQKRESLQSKNQSSSREIQEMEPQVKEQYIKSQSSLPIEKIQIEDEDNNYGIFSQKLLKHSETSQGQFSTMPNSSKSLIQSKDILEPDVKMPSFELLRGASEMSLGSNFPYPPWDQQILQEEHQIRLYVTPRSTSGTDNLFNKYLQ